MRRTITIPVLAMLCTLAILSIAQPGFAAEKAPPPAKKPPVNADAAMEKAKALGEHLGRALDLAIDLFSGNQADLLSKNKTALLSGNSPKVLTGDNPKVLSENTTPVFSGNTFSLLSNIKVEIHIENSGNGARPPQAGVRPNVPAPAPSIRPAVPRT